MTQSWKAAVLCLLALGHREERQYAERGQGTLPGLRRGAAGSRHIGTSLRAAARQCLKGWVFLCRMQVGSELPHPKGERVLPVPLAQSRIPASSCCRLLFALSEGQRPLSLQEDQLHGSSPRCQVTFPLDIYRRYGHCAYAKGKGVALPRVWGHISGLILAASPRSKPVSSSN